MDCVFEKLEFINVFDSQYVRISYGLYVASS
jgi:hypothetical protein